MKDRSVPSKDSCCPVCGLQNGHEIVDRTWGVVRCSRCSHLFVAQISGLPEQDLFNYDIYMRWRRDNQEHLNAFVAARAANLRRQLGPQKPGRVLEVGCSTGHFLAAMAQWGWDAYGVDLAERAIVELQNEHPHIHGMVGDLDEALSKCGEGYFDVIVGFHVVEHIVDLHHFMSQCARLGNDKCWLYFAMPHGGSWARNVFGAQWTSYIPEHYQFFTFDSISDLMTRNGFRVEALFTKSMPNQWLGGVKRKVKKIKGAGSASGKTAMPGRGSMKALNLARSLLAPLWRLEENKDGGGELHCIARRVHKT